MPRLRTVDDCLSDVQSMIDETNKSTVDPVRDILPSLNRAQVFAFDMLSKHYVDPLLFHIDQHIDYNTNEIDLPENVFEDRVMKIEFANAGYYYECKRLSYRDATYYEVPTTVPVPAYYTIYGRRIRFLPPPDGSFTYRMWCVREPENLVLQQGRIGKVSPEGIINPWVVVDSIGSDLTTHTNDLDCYVNIIDGETGIIKQSLQIDNFVDSPIPTIYFRTTPTRTTVLNRTITGVLDTTLVQPDDYICVVQGSCVPLLTFPVYNFLVQYAANEMNRKLKNESQTDAMLFKQFEDQVKNTWAGREMELRVKMKSKHWMPRRARRNTSSH